MKTQYKLAIGCDFVGYHLKCEIVKALEKKHIFTDVGCFSDETGLFAPAAKQVADLVASKEADFGILICGTGQGMAIAANKVKGIKAALCYDIFPAVLSKEHNNSNILCTGAWMIDTDHAIKMVEAWLVAKYAGNHDEGLALVEDFEQERT